MDELRAVLIAHAKRYPKMEPTDAVKLIYQNEFAGGHMIRDIESCLAYLRREYTTVTHDDGQNLVEDIGNGIVRVYLSALSEESVERLGLAFIRTAQNWQGSMERFQQKLCVLQQLCKEGVFSFDSRALDAYLLQYKNAGYPVVSHSDAYRGAYKPAYRVVAKSVW